MQANKALVIGWDGATFDIIKPLIAKGRMPHTAGLMEAGVHAPLRSTVPAVTPVAWTSCMTGVNPGKHGIFDAFVLDQKARTMRFVNASRRRVKPIWTLLAERGGTAGVVNVPVTYPPDDTGGVFISGMFTPPAAQDFMRPAGLREELEAEFGPYLESPKKYENPEKYLASLLEGADRRAELTMRLMERGPWDFFWSVFMESDRVQHFFWKYRDPAHPLHGLLGDAIERVYERLDAGLGRILSLVDEDTAVAMVSDHGFGPLHTAVFLNKWLIDEGYLAVKADMAELFTPHRPSALRRLAGGAARRLLPDKVRRMRLEQKAKHVDKLNDLFCTVVDWDASLAVSDGVSGGIYFNNSLMDKARRAGLVAEIREKLTALTDPATGQKAVEAVHAREDIFFGDAVEDAPDLIVVCAPGYGIIVPHEFLLYRQEYLDSVFVKHKWSGRHEQHGIFVLKSPGFRAGLELEEADMPDVAPTLLYALGEPAPDVMDGAVHPEAVAPETLAERPVARSDEAMGADAEASALSEEEELEIADNLKDLGYM